MNIDDAKTIAAAVRAIRPDWNPKSVATILADNFGHLPRRQVLLAMMWVASDPKTTTPGRVTTPGPWWAVLPDDQAATPTITGVPCSDHPGQTMPCRSCAADAIPPPPGWRAQIRRPTERTPA